MDDCVSSMFSFALHPKKGQSNKLINIATRKRKKERVSIHGKMLERLTILAIRDGYVMLRIPALSNTTKPQHHTEQSVHHKVNKMMIRKSVRG